MNPSSKIFKNPSYEQLFKTDGVLKIPFLTAEQVCEFRVFIEELSDTLKAGQDSSYHVTLLSRDAGYREKVKQRLHPCFDAWQQAELSGFRTITSNLIIKFAGSGEVPIHQNWSFVDETRSCSLTLWCPLQDTDEHNGTLYFLKGSHRVLRDVRRGPQVPYFFIDYQEAIRSLFEPIPVNAGEALLFDDAILHYSPANRSTRDRIAIQGNFAPKSEALFYYEFRKGWLRDRILRYPIRDLTQLEAADWPAIRAGTENPGSFPVPRIGLNELRRRITDH